MNKQLVGFLDKYKIIYKHQYGFQRTKSASLATLDLISKVLQSFEESTFSCCIFLYFAKVFDTVNNEILLSKLYHYGIHGIANDWFRDPIYRTENNSQWALETWSLIILK